MAVNIGNERTCILKKYMMNVVVIGLEAGNHLETREVSFGKRCEKKDIELGRVHVHV